MRDGRGVRERWQVVVAIAVLGAVLGAGVGEPAAAQEGQGLLFEGAAKHPGKLDFLVEDDDRATSSNLFWWSPTFKGGIGVVDPNTGEEVRYGGGFLRPLAGRPGAGELILGFHGVDTAAGDDFEAQAEYRWTGGWGIGGGFVEREIGPDVRFAKLTRRGALSPGWSYIVAGQAQEIGDETSPGGYAALYDPEWMVVAGHDGEQWRITAGYVAPESPGPLRPAAEVLWVDNDVGSLPGPRFLFANATLGFRGGFLSHPARLGRAMGPTGLEYGNPLAFLNPTWNRRLNVWELGGIAGFRAVRTELPSGAVDAGYEALVYPFQLDRRPARWLDGVFASAGYFERPGGDTSAAWAVGLAAPVGFLAVSIELEHRPGFDEDAVFVGLIDWF